MTKQTPKLQSETEVATNGRSLFGIRHSVIVGLSALAIATSVLAWVLFHRPAQEQDAPRVAKPPAPLPVPPTKTQTDSVEVFQRAFWQRPGESDKILHAERREWADADGVKKWQWFIAVEPSPELVKRLREENVFNLVRTTAAERPGESPEWFSFNPADVEILQSPGGNLRLFFSKTNKLLYATDSGGGFRPGAPEAPKMIPAVVAKGRLPTTSPPNPTPK